MPLVVMLAVRAISSLSGGSLQRFRIIDDLVDIGRHEHPPVEPLHATADIKRAADHIKLSPAPGKRAHRAVSILSHTWRLLSGFCGIILARVKQFVYNYRIFGRYKRPVASLAVLADEHQQWRPTSFGFETLGWSHTIKFFVAKLTDYEDKLDELLASDNAFG